MVITRINLFGKLNTSLFKSVALWLCKLRGDPYVELVHWLNQVNQQQDSNIQHIIRYFELDAQMLERDFAQALTRQQAGASRIADFSHHIELTIERAWFFASLERHHSYIRGGYLLIALLTIMELRHVLCAISPVFKKISLAHLSKDLGYIIHDSAEQDEIAGYTTFSGDAGLPADGASNAMGGDLKQYSTDLTALTRGGKIDPVPGRDKKINFTVMIGLCAQSRCVPANHLLFE